MVLSTTNALPTGSGPIVLAGVGSAGTREVALCSQYLLACGVADDLLCAVALDFAEAQSGRLRSTVTKGPLKSLRAKFIVPTVGVDGYGDGFGGSYGDACATERLWQPLVEAAIQEAAYRAKDCHVSLIVLFASAWGGHERVTEVALASLRRADRFGTTPVVGIIGLP